MTRQDVVLGVDVGTGGAKAIVMDGSGESLAAVTTEYPLSTPRPLWSEQDPHRWWTACATSIRNALDVAGVDAAQVKCVGLTGQMHGLVSLGSDGAVLRPAILWNDQRTAAECDHIHEVIGRETAISISGKPVLTGFTAPKILWVRTHEPDVHAQTAHVLLPKDYVRYRLTGALAMDVADASGTSLFDINRRAWSDTMLDALELDRGVFPDVFESPEVVAQIHADGHEATGLPIGTPVVAGAGDQAAEAIGCGIVEPGSVSVTIGTSGVVFAATDSVPSTDGDLHAYCHAIPGQWHVMGVMLSAGGSLRWHRDAVMPDVRDAARSRDVEPYDEMLAGAAQIPAGAEGLQFLPYLTGERTPYADPFARGAFVGLTVRHDRRHMTRAVLEGVAFGLRDALDLAHKHQIPVKSIRISGGGARSQLWRQILADVFAMPVRTVNVAEGAAYGAAVLASVGAGMQPDVASAARVFVRETSTTSPGANVEQYAECHDVYTSLYGALAPSFRRLNTLSVTDG